LYQKVFGISQLNSVDVSEVALSQVSRRIKRHETEQNVPTLHFLETDVGDANFFGFLEFHQVVARFPSVDSAGDDRLSLVGEETADISDVVFVEARDGEGIRSVGTFEDELGVNA
jgi:hypothetical protein